MNRCGYNVRLRWEIVVVVVCGGLFGAAFGQDTSTEPASTPVVLEDSSRAEQPDAVRLGIVVTFVEVAGTLDTEALGNWSDPTEEVAARLGQLRSEGKLRTAERYRVTTLDQISAQWQGGKAHPVAVGRTGFGGRGGPEQVQYQRENMGTMVQVTPRRVDGKILLELVFERSALAATTEDQPANVPAGTDTQSIKVTLSVLPGQTVLAASRETASGSDETHQLILVAARPLD